MVSLQKTTEVAITKHMSDFFLNIEDVSSGSFIMFQIHVCSFYLLSCANGTPSPCSRCRLRLRGGPAADREAAVPTVLREEPASVPQVQ